MEENIIKKIKEEMAKRFKLIGIIGGAYIKIDEFDGMVNIDTYEDFEELAISICYWIRENYDVDCDYEIIGADGEYDLRFEIIE